MKLCPVPEGTGWHIIVSEIQYGLATLILVPWRMVVEAEQVTVDDGSALGWPAGHGSSPASWKPWSR